MAAHALALSAGLALVILGLYLARRRRRAWGLAVVVLVASGVLNVLKGLDLEEALASWALAGGLLWGRESFHVLHDGDGFRVALVRSAAGWSAGGRRGGGLARGRALGHARASRPAA